MRIYYLSFADEGGFLGGCLVKVTPEDKARIEPAARAFMASRRAETGHAHVPITDDAVWLAVAHRLTHERGCNPGGEILSIDLTGHEDAIPSGIEFCRLYSRAELEAFGLD